MYMRRRRKAAIGAPGLLVAAVLAMLVLGTLAMVLLANRGPAAIGTGQPASASAAASSAASRGESAVLIGVGDIADCREKSDEATGALAASVPGTIMLAGDNAYENGSDHDYQVCFNQSWGALKARIRPAPGNHDYNSPAAQGYFDYFGSTAGEPGKGWYAYDLGTWRVYALNSNCRFVPCGAKSEQAQWLASDLAAHPTQCVLGYWHHGLFSSGRHGNNSALRPLFKILYDAGADVVVNGHDHTYERFAPQDFDGNADPGRGIREFVVGTGGESHYEFHAIQPNSEARNNDTFGLLKLQLNAGTYAWQFLGVPGTTFTDSGVGTCH